MTSDSFYPIDEYAAPYELVVYGLRIPGSGERLHRERAAWAEHGDIGALDEKHYVLIVRPGAALGVGR